MKRVAAFVLLTMLLIPGVALAGSSTDAALGLGAFAVFNQILSGTGIFGAFNPAPAAVVVQRPVYVQQPIVVAPPRRCTWRRPRRCITRRLRRCITRRGRWSCIRPPDTGCTGTTLASSTIGVTATDGRLTASPPAGSRKATRGPAKVFYADLCGIIPPGGSP